MPPPENSPASNFVLLRSLAGEMAADVADSVWKGGQDTVQVVILPHETAWHVRPSIVSALTEKKLTVLGETGGRYTAEFGVSDAGVRYGETFSSGLFAESVVAREVFLGLHVTVMQRVGGNIVYTRMISQTATDTLPVASIPDVENPNLSFTQGRVPEEGLFSSLLEPIVILGSIAVAVFLLFHVRS
jgi:hypothetical protein